MTTPSSCIILFIKAPIEGKVKTRLAKIIGPTHSVNLYKCFIKDTMRTLIKTAIPLKLFFYPQHSKQLIERWLGEEFHYYAQSGNDLGGKMADAFLRVFNEKFDRAILIGSDLPDLPHLYIITAFKELTEHSAVIGPANDGGYYLIGFRSETFQSDIFSNIMWGKDHVYENTMRKFAKSELNVHILPKWRDVDTYEDLKELENSLQNSKTFADETKNYLRLMKNSGII